MFIGRERELRSLEQLYFSGKFEFAFCMAAAGWVRQRF